MHIQELNRQAICQSPDQDVVRKYVWSYKGIMKSNYKITINMNMETLMHCLGGQNSACEEEDDEKNMEVWA